MSRVDHGQRGSVALVTGARGGLGSAICRALERDGMLVVATDVLASPPVVALDVTDEAAWARVVDRTVVEYGAIDVLVNNAGITGDAEPILSTATETFEQVLSVNLVGPFLGLRTVVPVMPPGSSIVNIASVGARGGFPGVAPYVSSKHGLIGLGRTAALELAGRDIRVNTVLPGRIATPMLERNQSALSGDDLGATVPMGRLAHPDEVADVVAFLASSRARFCTGAEFVVDGGRTAGDASAMAARTASDHLRARAPDGGTADGDGARSAYRP